MTKRCSGSEREIWPEDSSYRDAEANSLYWESLNLQQRNDGFWGIESLEVWGCWILHLDKVRTKALLCETITNNLLMCALLPAGKLFFYCCLSPSPPAIPEAVRSACLQFPFLGERWWWRGRSCPLHEGKGWSQPQGDTCPVQGVTCTGQEMEKGGGCRTQMQLLSPNCTTQREDLKRN